MVDVFGWFKKEVPIVEKDVLDFIKAVETNVGVAVTDAEKSLSWIAARAPSIAADVQALLGFVVAVPAAASNPAVLAAVTAANVAVQGLNAFATSFNQATTPGGGITLTQATQAVVQGYQAVKAAQIASDTASKEAVASTTTATTAPTS